MEIKTTLLPLPVPASGSSPAALPTWKLGQLLSALVLTIDPGRAVLDIGGRRVTAHTPLPLSPGQTLQLRVSALTPQIALAPVLERTAADTMAQALRLALPRQEPLTTLASGLRPLTGDDSPLPAAVHEAARRVLDTLPSSEEIRTPEGLRQALQRSGLFLEASLARALETAPAAPGQPRDLKALLLNLMQLASAPGRPATGAAEPRADGKKGPSVERASAGEVAVSILGDEAVVEVLRQTEAALARVQLHQLASLTADGELQSLWSFELPIRNNGDSDLLQLRIARDGAGGDGQSKCWSVTLNLDLKRLGPVRAVIKYIGGQISFGFWAERTSTLKLVDRHLDLLRARLQDAGLTVGRLDCHSGQAPPIGPDILSGAGLLDIRA